MDPYLTAGERLLNSLWRAGTRRAPSLSFISGPPRSGTTWLLEAVERHKGVRRIYEPIRGILTDARPYGYGQIGVWRPDQSSDESQLLKCEIHQITQNRPPRTMKRARSAQLTKYEILKRIGDPEHTLLKFVNLPRLLPWFRNEFDIRGLIVSRNPIDLVASAKEMRVRAEVWSQQRVQFCVTPEVQRYFPDIQKRIKSLDSTFNNLEWIDCYYCLDSFLLLIGRDGPAYIWRVFYEDLVRDGHLIDNIAIYRRDLNENNWISTRPRVVAPQHCNQEQAKKFFAILAPICQRA